MEGHHSIRWVLAVCGAFALAACAAEPESTPEPPPPPAIEQPPIAPAPGFAIALWPGEGIPQFAATGSPLPLRAEPRLVAASPDTLRPTSGQQINYDSTRFETVLPATIAVLRADTIRGRDFGHVNFLERDAYYAATVPTVRVAVNSDTRLELLQHRAEGTCFVRLDTRVIEADPCPLFDVGAFRPAGEPRTAWWILVAGPARQRGWVLVSDSTVQLAGRRF